MTVVLETAERQLTKVAVIDSVLPIENADAIEQVKIGGWTVVAKKDEFKAGDKCVYFEIDSQLPLDDERFAFLGVRGSKLLPDGTSIHRLKTARLRGVYSQGLALPAALFSFEIAHVEDDVTLDMLLGITKYEPALPNNMNFVGPFAYGVRKTDSERVQNLTADWPAIAALEPWSATEKIDGTSLTVHRDADGIVHVFSRNWEIGEGQDLYWRLAIESGIVEFLKPEETIQGEIFGEGVQGNPLGIVGNKVAIFSWFVDGLNVPRDSLTHEWDKLLNDKCVLAPIYDLEFPVTVDEAVTQVDGIKSLISPKRLAEGVVWHLNSPAGVPALGGRSTFKVISNKYLMKHDG